MKTKEEWLKELRETPLEDLLKDYMDNIEDFKKLIGAKLK